MQKTLKEKEFELFTVKNQKLEKLCRALQEERKTLYRKVQEGSGHPDVSSEPEPTERESPAVVETAVEKPNEEQAKKTSAEAPPETPKNSPAAETLLTKELSKLKSEQSLLEELATSFRISHMIPEEELYSEEDMSQLSQSYGHTEVVQDSEEQHHSESCGGDQTQEITVNGTEEDDTDDGSQEQRDLEMEMVD